MNIRSSSVAILTLVVSGACNDARESDTRPATTTALTAHATQRASYEIVGADTLSDSARILRLLPEQDGDAMIVLFADPARRVSAGLAINDRRMANPQLVWPDSVTSVWWTGPHTVAFTTNTGRGVRLVGDVHAATLRVADTTNTGISSPPGAATVDSSVAHRARAYIDSVHLQPAGAPQASALKYSVTRIVPSPDGTMAAFHSAARDPSGALTNPSWSVLDRSSGAVASLDRVTGALAELPADAGEWGGNSSFFYAKGKAVWEAEIQRATAPAPVR
jgi:hypothetical protein